MKLARQDQRFFINFFHIGARFLFFPAILMSSTHTDKNNLCLQRKIDIPNSVLFPISVLEHYRALFLRLPILAFLSSARLFPFWTKLQVTNSQVW